MNFRHRKDEEPEVNITPLIDIVFLLLIFFMISTTFKQEFEVGIELPQAESESRLVEKILEISIDKQGTYYLNGQKLVNTQFQTIKQALQKVAKGNYKLPVVISADGQTPHQAVIRAMDAAKQLGFSRLTFATQQESE
ncbi:MAG TPA: biopolymer transporter ExbD [Gammaproteobacteria bacterium]|nr:biopolymer transporter ExbD [Gammaproteobacteria bacterium]